MVRREDKGRWKIEIFIATESGDDSYSVPMEVNLERALELTYSPINRIRCRCTEFTANRLIDQKDLSRENRGRMVD